MIGIRDRNEPNGYKTNSTTQKVDATLSSTSNNPPSNKAVTEPINKLRNINADEEVIGTYLGKPLYRKRIDLKNIPSATHYTILSDVAEIRQKSLYYQDTALPLDTSIFGNGAWFELCSYNPHYDGVKFFDMMYLKQNGEYRVYIEGHNGTLNIKGVIEYTKTTD